MSLYSSRILFLLWCILRLEGRDYVKKKIGIALLSVCIVLFGTLALAAENDGIDMLMQDSTTSSYISEHSSTEAKINTTSKSFFGTYTEETTTASNYVETSDTNSPFSEEVSSKSDEREISLFLTKSLTGNGTMTDPFLIYTADQMTEIIKIINKADYTNSVNSGTVYIQLKNDITANGTFSEFTNNKNPIIIDGSKDSTSTENYSIYYSGSTVAHGIFSLGTSDMSIKFKNINFGSSESPRSTYYGLCYSTDRNNSINIENVNYYAEVGGQPFFIMGSNSSLNFSGNNSFTVSSNGSNNQEFAEFSGTLNFKEGSQTSIVQKSGEALAFIWARSNIDMNVEDNAKVFIQSGKECMIYPAAYSVNLNVSDSAEFTYMFDNNLTYIDPQTVFGDPLNYQKVIRSGKTNARFNKLFYNKQNLNISTANESKVNFITVDLPFQNGAIDINTIDPASVRFVNELNTNSALDSSTSLKVTNNSLNNTIYNLSKTEKASEKTKVSELILPGLNSNIATNDLLKYSAIIYEPAVKVGDITSEGLSGFNKSESSPYSKISSRLTGVSSTLDASYTYKAQYYITNDVGVILDDSTLHSQYNESTPPTHLGGSIYSEISSLPSIATETGDQSTVAHLDRLFSGHYMVYGRLAIIPKNGGQIFYSKWKHTDTTISPYQVVTFPSLIDINENISYKLVNGNFGLTFNESVTYPISNQSNQVVEVTLSRLSENTNNQVTMIPSPPDSGSNKLLFLNLFSTTGDFQINLGNLTSSPTLELQPYWDTQGSIKKFYINGKYSGPFLTRTPAVVDYNLDFLIKSK